MLITECHENWLDIEPEDRILFNISRMWKDEGPEDDSDSEDIFSDEASGNSQASVTVEEATQDLFV